jgi:hypothetical protein
MDIGMGLGEGEGVEDEKRESDAMESESPRKRALIFTMDSISQYEERSRKGGAAGEIAIRR